MLHQCLLTKRKVFLFVLKIWVQTLRAKLSQQALILIRQIQSIIHLYINSKLNKVYKKIKKAQNLDIIKKLRLVTKTVFKKEAL